MVDIRDFSNLDQQRAQWLLVDALDSAGDIGALNEHLNAWTWADEKGHVPAGAFFLFAAWAWPAVLELCAREGISKREINDEIGERFKQAMADYLRQDVTVEEAGNGS